MAPVAQTGAGNVTTATAGSAQSVTIAKPTTVADGDLLVAIVNAANSGGTWTSVPSGWTAITATSTNRTAGVWYKPVPSASAETATDYTFGHTGAGSSRMGGLIVRVTGADLGAPVDVAGSWQASLGATGVTTTRPGCLLLGAFWSYITGTTPNTVTPPGSMTSVGGWSVNPSASTTHLLAQEARPTAGVTGSRTATATPAGSSALSVLVAIAGPAEASATLAQPSQLAASATPTIPASATLVQPSAVTADATVIAADQDASATLAQRSAMVIAHPGQMRVLADGLWQPVTAHQLIGGTWVPLTVEE